jgi:hypothetical protein
MNKEKTAGGRREPIVFTIGLDKLMKTQLQETKVSTGNQEYNSITSAVGPDLDLAPNPNLAPNPKLL